MPVTVKLDWESEPLSQGSGGGSAGFSFNIYGAGSDFEAWAAVRDFSPALYLGLVRSNISVQQSGPNFHKGNVSYANVGPGGGDTADSAVGATPPSTHPAPATDTTALGVGYEFNYSAEMKHYTQSLATRYKRAAGDALNIPGSAPSYDRAVGVERSGGNVKVNGFDAPEPTTVWSVTVPVEPMTLKYKNEIRSLVGKKNAAPFYQSEAGEVVLWGVAGRYIDSGRYSLTFTFHERPNIVNKIIVPDATDPDDPELPNALVVPAASGWDHIWLVYEEEAAANELLKKPVHVYVEQIIADGDFTLLRLGA